MSVREYDQGEWRKLLQQTLISIGIVSFLHWKWAICPPLFIQCFMMPTTIYGTRVPPSMNGSPAPCLTRTAACRQSAVQNLRARPVGGQARR